MSFEIKSFDGKMTIVVNETAAINKTIEFVDDTYKNELSLYGEALRLREELLPKPQRIIKGPEDKDILIPAEGGIDVLTCTLQELSDALEDAKLNNYRVRTEFLLRILSVRFPDDFDPQKVNITKIEIDMLEKLKKRATNNIEFLGECGFGIDADGNHPTLKRVL